MKSGVSSACLYPIETEKALSVLCNAGIKTTEIFLNSPSEVNKSYLKELRIIADSYGVNISAIHPYTSGLETMMFFTDYPRRFNDGIEMYKGFFEGINILGGDIVVFHGMNKKMGMNIQEYAERYSKIVDAAKEQGVFLCHENVERTISRNPEFFTQLSAYLPNAKFVFDIKQAIRSDCDPFEMLGAMGSSIKHVHISDNSIITDCLPIGQGSFDFKLLAKKLKDIHYSGVLMLELYNNSYNGISDLVNSYNRIKQL